MDRNTWELSSPTGGCIIATICQYHLYNTPFFVMLWYHLGQGSKGPSQGVEIGSRRGRGRPGLALDAHGCWDGMGRGPGEPC